MTLSPNTSTRSSAPGRNRGKNRALCVGIVVSRFNKAITDKLLAAAQNELASQRILKENVTVIRVHGAVEIPLALQTLAEEKQYDFLVALGAVIRGDSAHFEYVCKIATEGILAVMLRYQTPVGFGVLTLLDKSQAKERIVIASQAVRAGLELALLKKKLALPQ